MEVNGESFKMIKQNQKYMRIKRPSRVSPKMLNRLYQDQFFLRGTEQGKGKEISWSPLSYLYSFP